MHSQLPSGSVISIQYRSPRSTTLVVVSPAAPSRAASASMVLRASAGACCPVAALMAMWTALPMVGWSMRPKSSRGPWPSESIAETMSASLRSRPVRSAKSFPCRVARWRGFGNVVERSSPEVGESIRISGLEHDLDLHVRTPFLARSHSTAVVIGSGLGMPLFLLDYRIDPWRTIGVGLAVRRRRTPTHSWGSRTLELSSRCPIRGGRSRRVRPSTARERRQSDRTTRSGRFGRASDGVGRLRLQG